MSLSSSLDIELTYTEALQAVAARRKLPSSQVLQLLKDSHDRLQQLSQWPASFDYARDPAVVELNPPLWELGHVALFYEHFCNRWVAQGGKNDHQPLLQNAHDEFNSFAVPKEKRYTSQFERSQVLDYYASAYQECTRLVALQPECPLTLYSAALSALHAEMHVESILFSMQTMGQRPAMSFSTTGPSGAVRDVPVAEWVRVPGGRFTQGWEVGDSLVLEFDNECPRQQKQVHPFEVRTTCTTEAEMIQFIQHGGYKKKELWQRDSPTSYWWLEKGHEMPKYWQQRHDGFYRRRWDEWLQVGGNLPVVGVSYYEADAVCSWLGGRLPSETEWEYLATNGGTTRFPWGDDPPHSGIANIDYSGDVLPVDSFPKGDNKWGVRQLIGNVWEWTTSPLYPYDGFRMDPLYREFTYPFMGFQNVLRGGAWTVPAALINSKYRYARPKNCDYEFFGFRAVKGVQKRKLDDPEEPQRV